MDRHGATANKSVACRPVETVNHLRKLGLSGQRLRPGRPGQIAIGNGPGTDTAPCGATSPLSAETVAAAMRHGRGHHMLLQSSEQQRGPAGTPQGGAPAARTNKRGIPGAVSSGRGAFGRKASDGAGAVQHKPITNIMPRDVRHTAAALCGDGGRHSARICTGGTPSDIEPSYQFTLYVPSGARPVTVASYHTPSRYCTATGCPSPKTCCEPNELAGEY